MKTWLIQHVRALLFTLRRLMATPLSSLLNILVIGIALSLPTGLYVLLQNIQSLAQGAVGTPQISVFLSMDASQDDGFVFAGSSLSFCGSLADPSAPEKPSWGAKFPICAARPGTGAAPTKHRTGGCNWRDER